MSQHHQSLLNQSLLHSLKKNEQDSIDQLYVNSVIAGIRETSTQENRGQLWESLHRSLLQLKASRAALQAVAGMSGGGPSDLDILKDETRQLFHQLQEECRSFDGNWVTEVTATATTTAAAAPPPSVPIATNPPSSLSLSAINPVPQQHQGSSMLNTTGLSILDQVLGSTTSSNPNPKHLPLPASKMSEDVWSTRERHLLAENLVRT